MKYLRISVLIVLVSALFACKKSSADGGGGTTGTAPTNLVLNAVVNSDNSGNVSFTATATGAVSYEYDFGNGIFQTVPAGAVTYKYPAAGTYTVNVTAKSAAGQTTTKSTQITVSLTAATLLWSEEFNTDGAPDPAKWGYDIGTGSSGWGNNELEYYTSRTDNVIVSNGTLKITAKKESYNGSAYTSARLTSNTKFSFKYGKVEIRAKLPAGGGTWPAIWMLGSDFATNPWPACGEIDIMEHIGNNLNTIYGTLHYPNHSGANGDGATTKISGATTDFHIYALEWTAAAMKISVDGVVFKTVVNSASIPFNHNFFMILNVAMGGGFAGAVDPAFTSGTMEIDYIRVSQ